MWKQIRTGVYHRKINGQMYFSVNLIENETALVIRGLGDPKYFILTGDLRKDINIFLTEEKTLHNIINFWRELKDQVGTSFWTSDFAELETK